MVDSAASSCSFISESESRFVFLYRYVIKRIYKEEWKTRDWFLKCTEALDIITKERSGMKDEEKKLYYNFVNYHAAPIRFAYLFAFGIINTSTAFRHFLYHFNRNEDVECLIKRKGTVRICCLGGGPGVEALAISKIIYEILSRAFPYTFITESISDCNRYHVAMRITIVDICSPWENEAAAIMNFAKEFFYKPDRLGTESKFIQADLLESFTTHLEEEIKEADIVTMVRLGSEIMERESDNISALCENLCRIVNLMKINSCLFIQDSEEAAFCHLKDSLCSSTSTNIETFDDTIGLTPDGSEELPECAPAELRQFTPVRESKALSCIWVKKQTLQEEEIPKI